MTQRQKTWARTGLVAAVVAGALAVVAVFWIGPAMATNPQIIDATADYSQYWGLEETTEPSWLETDQWFHHQIVGMHCTDVKTYTGGPTSDSLCPLRGLNDTTFDGTKTDGTAWEDSNGEPYVTCKIKVQDSPWREGAKWTILHLEFNAQEGHWPSGAWPKIQCKRTVSSQDYIYRIDFDDTWTGAPAP